MTCNNCGWSSCRCGFVTQKPYFADACQQQSGCPEKIYVCNYSNVLRVQGEWAVPTLNEIVTLNVPGLTDILIGSIIWNPDYGSFEVVAVPADEQIKITKTLVNDTASGTTVPSCTKFMTSLPISTESPPWIAFDGNWEAGEGDGVVSTVTEKNAYSVNGDRVDVSLNSIIEISTDTLTTVKFDLPFQPTPFSNVYTNIGQMVPCNPYDLNTLILYPGSILLLGDAIKGLVQLTNSVELISTVWNIQANFFYKKGV